MSEAGKRYLANRWKWARFLVLRVLKVAAIDISIKNPYSGRRFKINSYRHKSYWYFRGDREEDTVESLKRIVPSGGVIFEVGGHVGFLTHLYSKLAGPRGEVFVFEPGANNLPYTRINTKDLENVTLLESGCSNFSGQATFYKDSFSGQNNSLLGDYEAVENIAKSHYVEVERSTDQINVVALSDFIAQCGKSPAHIKIDVEGAELLVLQGLREFLGVPDSMMIEVTRDEEAVYAMMAEAGYLAFDVALRPMDASARIRGNVFFLKRHVAALRGDCA